MLERLQEQLILHEGLREYPYEDTEGYLTWGVGRNIDANPLTQDEVIFLLRYGREEAIYYCLEKDIQKAKEDCNSLYSYFNKLCPVRKRVLIDMAFNLGRSRLSLFKRMEAALDNRDYEEAAKEMLDSKWAKQVGQRAIRLADMMATGDDYEI